MKNLVNLGVILNKKEQKSINGGEMMGMCSDECSGDADCPGGMGTEGVCVTKKCDGSDTLVCDQV